MLTAPRPTTQGFALSRGVAAILILLPLTACGSPTGDFGEPRGTFLREDMHDWVGPEATGSVSSRFELTDDERLLRDLAYPLIEPAYERRRWYSIIGEYGYRGFFLPETYDSTAYAGRLFSDRYRSPAARYSQLTDDIRNDTTRLSQFFETAARVSDMDGKRGRSLTYISTVSPGERADAARRIRENGAIIRAVQASLDRRVASYRFAMERLVIRSPSPQAVEVERSLNQLRAGIAFYLKGAPTGRLAEVPLGRAEAPVTVSK
ncbi:MAG: hypothetical protein JO254_03340 [Pseudolabrys sp.]|nr:hypothetical protein [Pseudolabrys sp.]